MPLKDYYKILDVSPAATAEEIRKAYRKLAMRYHPDQNGDNRLAALQFNEIKEAYDTLSNKSKREAYNYERFYHYRYLKQKPPDQMVTPAWLLQQFAMLETALAKQDPFRIDQDVLLYQLQYLLSEYNLELLRHSADAALVAQLVMHALPCTRPLNFAYTAIVCNTLLELAGNDADTAQKIHQHLKQKKQQQLIDRYKLPAAIVAVLLLLLLIILATR